MQLQAFDLLVFKEQTNFKHSILYINICDKEFIFRTLGKKEYKDILNVCSNEFDLEDMICTISLMYPENFNFKDCGLGIIAKTICPLITQLSGFTDKNEVIQMCINHNMEMNEFENSIYAIIKMAFMDVTFEEMEEWGWDYTLKMASRAQYVLNKTIFINDPIELVQTEEEENTPIDVEKDYMELIKQGLDPMKYYENEIFEKPQLLQQPFIGGIRWKNEGVINGIRSQMAKSIK